MGAMEIGVMSSPRADGGNEFELVAKYGLRVTQFSIWNPARLTPEYAAKVKADAAATGVRIAAIWAGYSGPAKWNFIEGPATLGLVPPEYRAQRVQELKRAADFAAWCGVPAIISHCGFVPENPGDPLYAPTVAATREVAQHCLERGISFWFETGQETPVTLLRVIEDVALPNLGVNLDTANLILYGKANPLDALDVIGIYVRNLHAKDGLYPTNGRQLGKEVPIGKGKVNFRKIIARLHELGFTGDIIIEREIKGPQQVKDIQKAIRYLRRIIDRTLASKQGETKC